MATLQGLTIGRDLQVHFNTVNGPIVLSSDSIQSWESTPKADVKDFLPISGLIEPTMFMMGYQISIEIGRKDPSIENYWAQLEQLYFTGGVLPNGTIIETILEADGSVSQYVYSNVIFKLDSLGTYKGNEFVVQKVMAYASRRELLV